MKEHKITPYFIISISIMVLVMFTYLYCVFKIFGIEKSGQIGDTFGVFNPIISTLTVVGLAITIILQNSALKNQKNESSLSRIKFEEQVSQTQIQSFENTFFNLININRNIYNNISFKGLYKNDESHYIANQTELNNMAICKNLISNLQLLIMNNIKINEYREKYTQLWENTTGTEYRTYKNFKYGEFLSNYMRNVYHIINYIKSNESSHNNTEYYSKLFYAQLSDIEREIIFLNALSSYAKEKALPLFQKTGIMRQYLDQELHLKVEYGKIFESALNPNIMEIS